jgi:hypothetical protein
LWLMISVIWIVPTVDLFLQEIDNNRVESVQKLCTSTWSTSLQY